MNFSSIDTKFSAKVPDDSETSKSKNDYAPN